MTDSYDVPLDSATMPLDEEISSDGGNVLEQLQQELQREIERPHIMVAVPERPNISIRFSPNVSQEQVKSWQRNSGANSKRGMDGVKFASYVIAGTTVGIYINDQLVENDEGIALNFASQPLEEMTGASDPFEVIRAVFGVDAHIEAVAMSIIEHAGWGEEVDVEDPTKRR